MVETAVISIAYLYNLIVIPIANWLTLCKLQRGGRSYEAPHGLISNHRRRNMSWMSDGAM